MEPSTKKRKLAPKPEPQLQSHAQAQSQQQQHQHQQQSPAATQQHAPPPAPPAQAPPQSQLHYAVQEPPPPERHDFEAFARHLQDAAMLIQRQTETPAYADVSVLLLRWDDDKSAEQDLADLELVFQKPYGFHTQQWLIPTVPNPGTKLTVQMASFLENARPNHLFIICYVGYGYLSADGHLYWACNAEDDAAQLKWDGVRCLIEDAQSDILLLLDTCSIPGPPMTGRHGPKQVIAACSHEHKLSRGGSGKSFTSNLVEGLRKLSTGRPFSAQRLYEEIHAQKQNQMAQAARPENGDSIARPDSSQLPVFFTLAQGKTQSLAVAPVSSRPPPGTSPNAKDAHDGAVACGREDQLIDPQLVADLRFDEARVLVCTTFVGDASPDMSSFNQWLQDTPPLGNSIAVEGMFLGPPTMLLISMPHSIWNVVQHDKVCCFLGYVSSHNMTHLYQRLVGPPAAKPSAKEMADGRILLEARKLATNTPSRLRRDLDGHAAGERHGYAPLDGVARASYALAATQGTTVKPKDAAVEDSAEVQEAAEQLKALSHIRHRSDETPSSAAVVERRRTTLPDGSPKRRRSDLGPSHDAGQPGANDSMVSVDFKFTPSARVKPLKQDTRCGHCSHAPFKDSSSLRKHIATAHTRPFPCAFSFAGCSSTFGSKNEWKRHIASQHLCLQYYRCSECPQSTVEGKANEFNRKDLFTQHLRRMHAPFPYKRALYEGDVQLQAEWDAHVKEMQQTCLITRRKPPQISACPKSECQSTFEGSGSWDEWTEHVGRHMEKGEADRLGVDRFLAQWALDEGIIEPNGDGGMRFTAGSGMGGTESGRPSFDRRESINVLTQDTSQAEDTSTIEVKPAEVDEMEVDS